MSKIDLVGRRPAGVGSVRPPTIAEIEALRHVAGFAEAFSRLMAGLTAHYGGNRILNRILNDRGRALIGLLILDLHHNGADTGGLTATRLKQVCVETGVCSPGRVTAMLGALRLFGFLSVVPGRDRRVRRLVPTKKLLATHADRWRHFIEAIALLDPSARRALDRLADPAFVAAQVGVMASMYWQGMRMIDYAPELRAAAARDAGLIILISVAAEAQTAAGPCGAPIRLTISELARRFHVSRGHVLSVLRDAEREGLIRRGGPRGAAIVVMPALHDAVERFLGAGLLVHMAGLSVGLASDRAAG